MSLERSQALPPDQASTTLSPPSTEAPGAEARQASEPATQTFEAEHRIGNRATVRSVFIAIARDFGITIPRDPDSTVLIATDLVKAMIIERLD